MTTALAERACGPPGTTLHDVRGQLRAGVASGDDLLVPADQAVGRGDVGHGERRSIVVGPDAHPRLVACDVVDPVRVDLADFFVEKVVDAYFLRRPLRLKLAAAVLEGAASSFFFASTEMTGCWAAIWSRARALMYSNCAFRSGLWAPSSVLALSA